MLHKNIEILGKFFVQIFFIFFLTKGAVMWYNGLAGAARRPQAAKKLEPFTGF